MLGNNKKKYFDRFLEFLGFEAVEEEEELDLAATQQRKKHGHNLQLFTKKPKLDLETKGEIDEQKVYAPKIVNLKLLSFNDARKVVDYLKNNRLVSVNLTELEIEQAERVLDYLSGVIFTIDGKVSKLGNGIFIFTSSSAYIENSDEKAQEQLSGRLKNFFSKIESA